MSVVGFGTTKVPEVLGSKSQFAIADVRRPGHKYADGTSSSDEEVHAKFRDCDASEASDSGVTSHASSYCSWSSSSERHEEEEDSEVSPCSSPSECRPTGDADDVGWTEPFAKTRLLMPPGAPMGAPAPLVEDAKHHHPHLLHHPGAQRWINAHFKRGQRRCNSEPPAPAALASEVDIDTVVVAPIPTLPSSSIAVTKKMTAAMTTMTKKASTPNKSTPTSTTTTATTMTKSTDSAAADKTRAPVADVVATSGVVAAAAAATAAMEGADDVDEGIESDAKSSSDDNSTAACDTPGGRESPKRIRFPPPRAPDPAGCQWEGCLKRSLTGAALTKHLVTVHIEPQQGKLQAKRKTAYVCRWIGCKVFGRPSYADGWVSRHVLSAHGRAKPFMCVFPGCYQSFGSEINLRRHVNLHCDNGSGSTNDERVGGSVSTSSNAVGRKSAESTPVKNGKKNNRKGIRYRKRPWSAEKCDFWDPLMSEALSNQLTRTERLIFSSVRSPAAQENGELVQSPSLHPAVGASLMHPFFSQKSCSSITFTGEVIGSRLQSGCKMSLVRWMPHDLLPDEWMTEAEVAEKELLVKTVPVGALSTPAFEISQRLLLGPAVQKRLRPSRRK